MNSEFRAAYKQLNVAQRQAVDAIDGPVLVIAGPGTGKTQLLSLRVANILNHTDSDAANIICLTFTDKAAVNMRERLYKIIGPSSRGVEVRTFHSFAAQIMNQYPDYFWNGARLSSAPDAVQDDIIQTILARLPLKNPLSATFGGQYTALNDVKNALKLAKEAGLTPSELTDAIKQNSDYIKKIERRMVTALGPPLKANKLDDLQTKISQLPEQIFNQTTLLLPLSTVIKESLAIAVQEDMPTAKTKATGKWKQRWVQTINGEKGMFNEIKRNEWWLAVAEVYDQYRQQLHTRGYYDYADMLIEVLEQLNNNPDMLADIQERYLYVLIDEFQDTNAAQLRLAHLISDHPVSEGRPNLMAVGDDDQSIFAFNGAELNNMLGFRRSYPDTKLIVLTDNYRSSETILKSAQAIIEQAEDRLVNREPLVTKNLIAKTKPNKKSEVAHFSYPTKAHQYSAVAGQIAQLWNQGEKDIAVLARTHDSLRQIAAILHRHDLPVRYDRRSNILDNEAVKTLFQIGKTAASLASGDRTSVNFYLSALLRHPMWRISPRQLWTLATANYSNPDWLDNLLTSPDQKLADIGNWLVWLARTSHDKPLPLQLEYMLGLSEGEYLLSPFKTYYITEQKLDSEYLEALSALEILRGLTREFAQHGRATLGDFVRFIELNVSNNRVIADESWFNSGEQAIQLLTIYKAKGLEFDFVYIVDAVESMWRPKPASRISPANLMLQAYGEKYDDYIRLLYVAATRAKRSFIASSYFTDDRGNELLPTPLIGGLPLTQVDKPGDEPVHVLETDLRWPALNIADEKNLLQDRLENFALSPTSLKDFLDLSVAGPLSFKERHLIRLPRERSIQGSYGNAIHAALETAQRLINTATLQLTTVLDRFEAALKEEHLEPNDFERYKNRGEELLEKLLGGDQQLLHKGGLAEQRISDVQVGPARLKGTLDRIETINHKLVISDYKTGKPLNSFDTRDQTKLVKAWRHRNQLLFYTLLVTSSHRFGNLPIERAQMLYLETDSPKFTALGLQPTAEDLERLSLLIKTVWEHVMALNFPDPHAYSQDMTGIRQFEDDLINGKI